MPQSAGCPSQHLNLRNKRADIGLLERPPGRMAGARCTMDLPACGLKLNQPHMRQTLHPPDLHNVPGFVNGLNQRDRLGCTNDLRGGGCESVGVFHELRIKMAWLGGVCWKETPTAIPIRINGLRAGTPRRQRLPILCHAPSQYTLCSFACEPMLHSHLPLLTSIRNHSGKVSHCCVATAFSQCPKLLARLS